MSTTSVSLRTNTIAPVSKLWWVGLVAGVTATVANLIVYFVAQPLTGGELYHQMGPGGPVQILPLTAVIFASFVPALAATAFYALLGRFTPRPLLIFFIVSAVALLVSLGSPLSLSIGLQYKLVLSIMHIVAGVSIVGVLAILGRK